MVILVTGGAGFIGSHLVDFLMEAGKDVRVLDNLSAGSLSNIERWMKSDNFGFIKGDLLNTNQVFNALEHCDVVYHLAANPEVRSWKAGPRDHYRQNIEGTFNLLEAVRRKESVQSLVFSSTSTVYGEPHLIPTAEIYAPMKPISSYGASKLAAEAMICSYASMYDFKAVIFRMANVVGPRTKHGVVYDFIQKLREDERVLEVLGDGTQSKSYLHVDDCVEGMIIGPQITEETVDILNIGSSDRVNVLTIAEIVVDEMGLKDVEIQLTGGIDGGRGWKGDVKLMQLDMSRLESYGWKPKHTSVEAIRLTARSILLN
ncbi:MAG: NAD-dependent epimerase/dehydratase family protein [Desulfobacteraceae bacterium]|nr:NAD-dependent epimerase/dehydratase family protein [Desulfobacteraceae bacterium]